MEKRIGSTVAEFLATEGKDSPIPEDQVQAIWDELERDGLICRTGQLRDGAPVYIATDKGRAREEVERLERFDRDGL
jgi:DNA-binding PadR family transcriptional regulator